MSPVCIVLERDSGYAELGMTCFVKRLEHVTAVSVSFCNMQWGRGNDVKSQRNAEYIFYVVHIWPLCLPRRGSSGPAHNTTQQSLKLFYYCCVTNASAELDQWDLGIVDVTNEKINTQRKICNNIHLGVFMQWDVIFIFL